MSPTASSLTANVTVFGDVAFEEVIKVGQRPQGWGPNSTGLKPAEETPKMHAQGKANVRTWPGEGLSASQGERPHQNLTLLMP